MTSDAMNHMLAAIRDELHDAAEELSRASSLMSQLGMPEEEETALLSAAAAEMMKKVKKTVRGGACPEPKIFGRDGRLEMNEATRRFVLSDLHDELSDAVEELFAAAIMMSRLGMPVKKVAEKAARVSELRAQVTKMRSDP
jgi:hypothetical protein